MPNKTNNLKLIKPQNSSAPIKDAAGFIWENPGKAINREGLIIDTSTEVWNLSQSTKNLYINWQTVGINNEIKEAMKAYFFRLVESQQGNSVIAVFDRLKHTLKAMDRLNSIYDLSYEKITGLLNKLRSTNTEWKFANLRQWYKWCFENNIPGFDGAIVKNLEKLSIPGFKAGVAVLTRDPEKGPFSDKEFSLIKQAVKNEAIPLLLRICIMLLLELGIRPEQVVQIDKSDLKVIQKDEKKVYSLDITQLKQQIVGKAEKKRRRITNALGENIELLIKENQELYVYTKKEEEPLFCSKINSDNAPSLEKSTITSLTGIAVGRMTTRTLRCQLQKFAQIAQLRTAATKKLINLYPYRFRYTFGVKHANSGVPPIIMADMFDHKSTNSTKIYVKSSSNSVSRLNATIGSDEYYQETMGNFLGKVVEHPSEPSPNSILSGTTPTLKNLGGIGQCGANFLCNLYPPLSCYVCPKFLAWKDGPHEQMLQELKAYVKQLGKEINNSSNRIPGQLDEVMQAIEVLLLKIKEDQNNKGDDR